MASVVISKTLWLGILTRALTHQVYMLVHTVLFWEGLHLLNNKVFIVINVNNGGIRCVGSLLHWVALGLGFFLSLRKIIPLRNVTGYTNICLANISCIVPGSKQRACIAGMVPFLNKQRATSVTIIISIVVTTAQSFLSFLRSDRVLQYISASSNNDISINALESYNENHEKIIIISYWKSVYWTVV